MISFQVDDMTCGHCVSTLTKALKEVDLAATVHFDLATHRVDIEPAEADASALGDAIKEAGYTPVALANSSAPAATGEARSRGGCCCG